MTETVFCPTAAPPALSDMDMFFHLAASPENKMEKTVVDHIFHSFVMMDICNCTIFFFFILNYFIKLFYYIKLYYYKLLNYIKLLLNLLNYIKL